MATAIDRVGYGQVEPNHLSAQKTGQIYAQLPAMSDATTAITHLEQGQFLKYNYAAGRASLDGDGEWMLVYCEEKLYDPRRQMHKDFCLEVAPTRNLNTVPVTAQGFGEQGYIYPRLLKTNIGDIYTTNTFAGPAAGPDAAVTGLSLTAGTDYLEVDSTTGYLKKATSLAAGTAPVFQVVKEYNMPDGQPGVKIMRVK